MEGQPRVTLFFLELILVVSHPSVTWGQDKAGRVEDIGRYIKKVTEGVYIT